MIYDIIAFSLILQLITLYIVNILVINEKIKIKWFQIQPQIAHLTKCQ